jgi:hypothetical protein
MNLYVTGRLRRNIRRRSQRGYRSLHGDNLHQSLTHAGLYRLRVRSFTGNT